MGRKNCFLPREKLFPPEVTKISSRGNRRFLPKELPFFAKRTGVSSRKNGRLFPKGKSIEPAQVIVPPRSNDRLTPVASVVERAAPPKRSHRTPCMIIRFISFRFIVISFSFKHCFKTRCHQRNPNGVEPTDHVTHPRRCTQRLYNRNRNHSTTISRDVACYVSSPSWMDSRSSDNRNRHYAIPLPSR